MRVLSISSFVGLVAAVMAWGATILIVGSDEVYVVQGRVIEWGTVIAALTAIAIIGVLISMYKIVEPIFTALAAAAGCALLYNTREYPLLMRGGELRSAGSSYWTVVISMILIFIVLLVGLRLTRNNSRNY